MDSQLWHCTDCGDERAFVQPACVDGRERLRVEGDSTGTADGKALGSAADQLPDAVVDRGEGFESVGA